MGVFRTLKWLCLGAWLALCCLSVSGAFPRTQKATAPQTSARSERTQASLQTVSYSPAGRPQSSSSSTSTQVSSKKKSRKKKAVSKREPTQMFPTPERISEVQSALARGGYYKTDPTGKWDLDTVDAVQRFQSANGLDTTGKLDALTLQKLGLGSDVAGVSAPKGIVPHSCCSMSPSPSYAPPTSAAPTSSSAAASPAPPADGGTPGSGSATPPANDPH